MKPISFDMKSAVLILFIIAWLCGLAIANYHGEDPINSIFPYLLPVMLIAWFHGAAWGFLVATLATLAAIPVDQIGLIMKTEINYGVLSIYAKLTGAAIGAHVARIIYKAHSND